MEKWLLLEFQNGWQEPSIEGSIEDVLEASKSREHFLILPDFPLPKDTDAVNDILKRAFKASGGRLVRAMPGVEITVKPLGNSEYRCNCTGNCFCVHENGSCQCEGRLCTSSGCFWGVCPGSC